MGSKTVLTTTNALMSVIGIGWMSGERAFVWKGATITVHACVFFALMHIIPLCEAPV